MTTTTRPSATATAPRVPEKGDRVRVPKGTAIHGTFPEGVKAAGRTYTVVVHNVDGGYDGLCYCRRKAGEDDGTWTDDQQDPFPGPLADGHSKHCVRPRPAEVCWVGTGGYWHYARVDAVTVVDT